MAQTTNTRCSDGPGDERNRENVLELVHLGTSRVGEETYRRSTPPPPPSIPLFFLRSPSPPHPPGISSPSSSSS